jgi:uncharacterized protein YecT (DUF1311 family)
MRILGIAVFSLASYSCNAADLYTPQLKICIDKSGGVTVAMIDCINAEAKIQDRQLNANYQSLLALLSEPRKRELLESQRAWLKFRELNCKFYYDPEGGTMARIAANDCFLNATAQRAAELKSLRQQVQMLQIK